MTEPRGATPRSPTPPTEPAASDVGRLVGGRYRLGELVGIGGMATVHRAIDARLDRAVAVKLLRREVIGDPDIAMRFRREALAATVLRHPNIVACLEAGTDDGQPYLVMELIEGEDLAARLRRVGRLEPVDVARLGLDVARALGVAHVRGIVHRDVKPGNILLARDGRAMVTDFGIARLAADSEGAVPGTTLGSVQYFSPEQARGATTTAASDVYGLGLVMYEALTGRRAWAGDTTAALAAVRIGAPAPSPRAVRPEVPGVLDAIVVRAMDPDPARRYENGGALAAAIEPLFRRPDPASPTVATATGGLAAATATGAMTTATGGLVAAAGVAGIAAVGGGAGGNGAGIGTTGAAGSGSAAAAGVAAAAGAAGVAGVAGVAGATSMAGVAGATARPAASGAAGAAAMAGVPDAGGHPRASGGGAHPRAQGIAMPLVPPGAAPAVPPGAAPAPMTGAAPAVPPGAPPAVMPGASRAAVRSTRRPPPIVAGPILVLLTVVVVVGGALYIAALPPGGDASGLAAASATPRPTVPATPRPTPTPQPTRRPTPAPTPTPKPTPAPTAAPKPAPAVGTPDVCDPIFGLACGLDPGRYAPAVFEPAIRFDLRDRWSTAAQTVRLLVLRRPEGVLTFASGIDTVFPAGDATRAPTAARAIVETFITTDGVASGKPADRKVDKRRARLIDLWPSGRGRLPLFGSSGDIYYLEPSGPTRVVVVDGPGGLLIIVAEAGDGSTIDDLWPEAKRVIDSVRFR